MDVEQHNQANEIIDFWFSDEMSSHWFSSTAEIDRHIQQRFEAVWQAASRRELDHWMSNADNCLALIIVLDQFPLNMYRGEARSFETESQAIDTTLYGIEKGYDQQLTKPQLAFFYMPLMHSESLDIQDISVEKYSLASLEFNLRFAKHHRELVARFGRFPHRNKILGRDSSPDELEYLASKQAFKG